MQLFQFGPWLFNVNGARAIIVEAPRTADPYRSSHGLTSMASTTPKRQFSLFSVQDLDRDYAMTTDLDEPVLVATLQSSLSKQFPLAHRRYAPAVQGIRARCRRTAGIRARCGREPGHPRGRIHQWHCLLAES